MLRAVRHGINSIVACAGRQRFFQLSWRANVSGSRENSIEASFVTLPHRRSRPTGNETVPHRGTLWVGASFCSIGGRATTLKPSCVFNNLRSCFFLGMSRHPERTGPRTLFSFRGPRRQVFVCGGEFGGGESKDLHLRLGTYAKNFQTHRLAGHQRGPHPPHQQRQHLGQRRFH